MFIQILIAILMGLSHPSHSNQSCNGTTVNSTASSTEEGGGTGTGTDPGGDGTGGENGQIKPPK